MVDYVLAIILFALGLFLVTPAAFAQKLSFGVVAGGSITDDFQTATYTSTGFTLVGGSSSSTFLVTSGSSFIVGPKLELRLPRRLSVEVDVLHRELHSSTTILQSLPTGVMISSFGPFTRTHTTWEFPLLAKYQIAVPISSHGWTAFVEAGPSLRPAGTGEGLSHQGITAGAGVEMHLRSLNVAPVVSYTRWASRNDTVQEANLNQIEFLVGFDQTSASAWPTAFGQRPAIGIVAGTGLTGDFRAAGEVESVLSRMAGVMVEFKLPKHLSVEVDGMYRPLYSREDRRGPTLTWEFPLLAKYKFALPRLKPLGELGPSFRATGNLNSNPSHYGVTAGAGLETAWGKLKIAPVVRYTRWKANNGEFRTIPNQVELLVGLSF